VTIGKMLDIEARVGAPPTPEELAEYRRRMGTVVPAIQQVTPSLKEAGRAFKASGYRNFSLRDRRRFADWTPQAILLDRLALTTSRRRPARAPRTRQVRRAVSARGSPRRASADDGDPHEHDLVRPRRFGAVRAWIDAHVHESRVWRWLEFEAEERLRRYTRGEEL
jgi:hypothetical protein